MDNKINMDILTNQKDYEDFSIINFMRNNALQICLFILVFIIIYVVDYISHVNSLIFAIPSTIPGLPASPIHIQKVKKISKKSKK